MSAVINTKPRTMWITALGALLLIWSLWALRQHSQATVEVMNFNEGTAPTKAPAAVSAPAPAPASGSGSASASASGSALAQEPEKVSSVATPVANPPTATVTAERKNQVETDRPLILYAYFETENSRKNFEFFVRHGLHAGADFLFILNGENKAEDILPKEQNIKYIKRANDCYDLGAFAEVLLKDNLYKKYKRYITLNASIRGPFLPYWSTGCWSDMYLDRITDTVKLMGMTFNCKPANHVQSMIWATDRIGLEILLFPTEEQTNATRASLPPLPEGEPVPEMDIAGINSCPHEYWRAVAVEVYSTPLIKAAGYDVDTMMTAFHMSKNYQEECREYKDALYENSYFGTNLHPYDTVFAKANRGTNALTLERLTEWMGGRNYTSYDFCPS